MLLIMSAASSVVCSGDSPVYRVTSSLLLNWNTASVSSTVNRRSVNLFVSKSMSCMNCGVNDCTQM